MNAKQLVAVIITASITAVIVSFFLKAIGLPDGDAHPIITSAIASVAAILVGQKFQTVEDKSESQ